MKGNPADSAGRPSTPPPRPGVPDPTVPPTHTFPSRPGSPAASGPLRFWFSQGSGSSSRNPLSIFSLRKKNIQIWRLWSPRLRVFTGRRRAQAAPQGRPESTGGFAALALLLGFPEISPRALGGRSHARLGRAQLARGAGARRCLNHRAIGSGENMGWDSVPEGGCGASGYGNGVLRWGSHWDRCWGQLPAGGCNRGAICCSV